MLIFQRQKPHSSLWEAGFGAVTNSRKRDVSDINHMIYATFVHLAPLLMDDGASRTHAGPAGAVVNLRATQKFWAHAPEGP
ncbi:hypothetical protein AS189_08130 [Arthrobacter alpinus]|uniref:Uncharacterized protein n=1 Tax=Arthrobacter alpinus TaxID=656366 RepID=A0A0S2LYC9_9MICC|nr:hypothetical protein AS189_08130 [Arthrobacter alpinus]